MLTLLILVIAGILGPLLAAPRRWRIPVIVGEIAGGMIVGPHLLGWLDQNDPIAVVLHDAGFALLMFGIGMRLPLRDANLRSRLGRAAVAVAITAAGSAILGTAISAVTHFGHPWVIAVLLSTSSASIAMPILRERDPDLAGKETSAAAAWILFADLLTVMVLPIVGGNVTEIPRMVLSSLALAVIAGVAVFIMTRVTAAAWWQHTRSGSKANQWGWDLRIAMLLLFGFSTMASMWGASALIAGFTAGVVMNLAGPNPYRLGQQLVGIGDGFLIPVFFVVLGARLDVNAFTSVELWALVGLMLVGTVVVHVLAARLTRQDLSVGLLASAQMGVPAAITTIGVSQGWLSAAQGTAFMTCALLSVGVCSLGAGILHRAQDAAGFPSAPAEL